MVQVENSATAEQRIERLEAELRSTHDRLVWHADRGERQQERADALEKQLRELLAVINRDGGHYTNMHGIERSARRAGGMIAIERATPAHRLALDQTVLRLQQQLKGAESQIRHWRSNHDKLVFRNKLLSQRDDLPLHRIEAYQGVRSLQRGLLQLGLIAAVVDADTLPGPVKLIAESYQSANTITHRHFVHVKSGGHYVLLFSAKIEADGTDAVVYQSLVTGETWVRPTAEFFDGRFQEIEPSECDLAKAD